MSDERAPVRVHVVRVFCDDSGNHGNPLGVVVDGAAVPGTAARQEMAYELGFSETVFIDDVTTGALRIFTPTSELPLAGHPLVGTAWLLDHLGTPATELRPPAGVVPVGVDPGGAWIEADPTWAPDWHLEEVASPDAVDGLDAADRGADAVDYVWAWMDRPAGTVRARAFVAGHGIEEDEATGSAALRLAARVGRPLQIHQGRGSRIDARPTDAAAIRVVGRVVLDDDALEVATT